MYRLLHCGSNSFDRQESGDRLAPQPIVLASVQSVSVGGGTTRGVPEDRRDGSVHGLMEAFSSVESSSGPSLLLVVEPVI